MAYTLHPATVEDAEAITSIMRDAFADDHIMSYFYPDVPKDVVYQRDLSLFRDWISHGDAYGGRFTKAVENKTGYESAMCDGP